MARVSKYQRRYYNEYLLAKFIKDLNTEAKKDSNQVLVTASQGRAIRTQMNQFMLREMRKTAEPGVQITSGFNTAGTDLFYQALSDSFKTVFPDLNIPALNDDREFRTYADDTMQDFCDKMHLSGGKVQAKESGSFGMYTKLDGTDVIGAVPVSVLPLSPYDPRFRYRSAFLQAGTDILYTPIDGGPDEIDHRFMDPKVQVYSAGRLVKDDPVVLLEQTAKPACSLSDVSGITRLARFIPAADFEKLADWVGKAGSLEDRSNYMSSEALNRSVAILEELENEGLPFTIEPDANIGQLKCNLTGTKISIRVMETKQSEEYVGRVYDDGVAMYFGTTKKLPNHKLAPYEDVTAQDCVSLLHYALGRHVDREDAALPVGHDRIVQKSGWKGSTSWHEAYHANGNCAVTFKDMPGNPGEKVRIYSKCSRSRSSIHFQTPEDAEAFLKEAVQTARENFVSAVDIDYLIQQAAEHGDETDYTPVFSGEPGVAAVQMGYWEVLTGKAETLLKPGIERDEYTDMLEDSENVDILQSMAYTGTPEEKVRAHLIDNVNYLVGTYEPDMDGKRFDTVTVSTFMTSNYGRWRNNDNLISALRTANIEAEELRGDSFFNSVLADNLVKFDPNTARPMAAIADPFVQTMFRTIKQTINETGAVVKDDDILFDENGIVHYTAKVITNNAVKAGDSIDVSGEIGQIFVPGEHGLVKTQFNGSQNYLFSPGYEAYVLPQKPGENRTLEERTRLKGYEQKMQDSIRYRLRNDLIGTMSYTSGELGSPTSINNTYRALYDTRYPLDFMERSAEEGMSEDLRTAIIETNARRVRYANEFAEGSSINAEWQASNGRKDGSNDNFRDPYQLSGRRDMSSMPAEGDAYFDKSATSTSTNQGIVRYLNEGTKVAPDGHMIPSDIPNDQTPLMKHNVLRYMDYVPFDRRQMTFSNLLKAACVTDKVKVAQMSFGGWTFDDGFVVSKEFAEKYQVRTGGTAMTEGSMRPLRIGDKISDHYGNKGVISLVVDPDMSEEEALKQGIAEPVAWFKANKGNLDIVGAPFSGVSRFNAGSAKELMENPSDLIGPDGTLYEGCVGEAQMIITHMNVDEKTHIYGEDELAQGKGRKASAQLAWALTASDCKKVMQECYGPNVSAYQNLREMLILVGLDIDEKGQLQDQYTAHMKEKRAMFDLPDVDEYVQTKLRLAKDGEEPALNDDGEVIKDEKGRTMTTSLTVNQKKARDTFGQTLGRQGGFLRLPFPLQYATDKTLTENDGMYELPVLSLHLRSGQELQNGQQVVHDYTNDYMQIYMSGLDYQLAQKTNDTKKMAEAQTKAQLAFSRISRDVVNRKFQGKHNIFRDGIMSCRMPHSATAVWTADPRLDLDQVAVGEAMAKHLNVKDNDYIMVWRDPVLQDSARYMRVKINPELVGCAINPICDKPFDGDFDGDAVGLLRLMSQSAMKEAWSKLSFAANLLNKSDVTVKNEVQSDGTVKKTGFYGLYVQDGLDIKSAQYQHPELGEEWNELVKEANEAHARQNRALQEQVVSRLSDLSHRTFDQAYGTDMLCFRDTKSLFKSLEHCVHSGAKGSISKLKDYGKYYGVSFETKMAPDEHGKEVECIDFDKFHEDKQPLATREDDLQVQKATAVKAFGTGIAGMYSQRGIKAMRNLAAESMLHLTYSMTQSILQSKHDAVEAIRKYDALMNVCRNLWRGYDMERVDNQDGSVTWKPVRDPENPGKYRQATKEDWIKSFEEIYSSPYGANVKVSPFDIVKVADALENPRTGKMRNIEDKTDENMIEKPLDTLAYGGTLDDLTRLCQESKNLFEGEYNVCFIPYAVQNNLKAWQEGRIDDVKPIMKSDVKAEYRQVVKASTVNIRDLPAVGFEDPELSEQEDVGLCE